MKICRFPHKFPLWNCFWTWWGSFTRANLCLMTCWNVIWPKEKPFSGKVFDEFSAIIELSNFLRFFKSISPKFSSSQIIMTFKEFLAASETNFRVGSSWALASSSSFFSTFNVQKFFFKYFLSTMSFRCFQHQFISHFVLSFLHHASLFGKFSWFLIFII